MGWLEVAKQLQQPQLTFILSLTSCKVFSLIISSGIHNNPGKERKHMLYLASQIYGREKKLRFREVSDLPTIKQLICCRNWSPVPFYYLQLSMPSKDQRAGNQE